MSDGLAKPTAGRRKGLRASAYGRSLVAAQGTSLRARHAVRGSTANANATATKFEVAKKDADVATGAPARHTEAPPTAAATVAICAKEVVTSKAPSRRATRLDA